MLHLFFSSQEMLKVVVEDPRRASEARYVKNMTTHNLSQPPRRGSPVSNTASEAFSLADGIVYLCVVSRELGIVRDRAIVLHLDLP